MLWWTLRKLRSSRWKMRAAAAELLGKRREARSIPGLIQLLEDDTAKVRHAAAEALGKIGDAAATDAAEALRLATQDSDQGVQLAAVEALRKTGGDTAITGLRAALETGKRPVREAAALALKAIGFQSGSVEERAAAAVLAGDFAAAVAQGEAAVTPLIDALGSGEAGFAAALRRREAAHALAQLQPTRKRIVKSLLRTLSDDDAMVRDEAVHALIAIGPPAVDGLLSAVANFWTSQRVEQRLAATALGAIGDVRAAKGLAEAVVRDRRFREGGPGGLVARCAASALKILLTASSASFSEADLRFVADLPDVYRVEQYGDLEPPDERVVLDLDCDDIRNLAQQELMRREPQPGS